MSKERKTRTMVDTVCLLREEQDPETLKKSLVKVDGPEIEPGRNPSKADIERFIKTSQELPSGTYRYARLGERIIRVVEETTLKKINIS